LEHNFFILAEWILLAVIATILSIRLGIAVALIEVVIGAIASNLIYIEVTPWVNVLASFGAVTMVFLAGAEIEHQRLKKNLKESLTIGLLSFLLPFLGVMAVAHYVFGWDSYAAKIAGLGLATTSVAVVYAVIVEGGLAESRVGQSILAACFVTDFLTVIMLGILFTGYSLKLVWFVCLVGVVVVFATPLASRLFAKFGGKVSEPEIKFIFLLIAVLAYIAIANEVEAVLPSFILGLAMAGFFAQYKHVLHKMRSIVYVSFTPFFFIKAGTFISFSALYSMAGIVFVFLFSKMFTKFSAVYPASLAFDYSKDNGVFFSLLMSSGLTFGAIAALFGLTNNYITSDQYSVIVAAVLLSAVVPTVTAQKFFSPTPESPVKT
jgi:Kef-type K+ transport system membrane component KefB